MTEFKFSEDTSKKSTSIIELNCINTERKAKYVKTFINRASGKSFQKNDVQILKYKRNLLIEDFFRKYSSNIDYSMIEIGFDFKVNNRVADILLKLKRNLNKIGIKPLEYFWIVDKGDVFGQMHFHLVVAIDRIDVKGKKLPKELKLNYKGKKVHSALVSIKNDIRGYLLRKPIFFIGKRKRVFGKSREKKTNRNNLKYY